MSLSDPAICVVSDCCRIPLEFGSVFWTTLLSKEFLLYVAPFKLTTVYFVPSESNLRDSSPVLFVALFLNTGEARHISRPRRSIVIYKTKERIVITWSSLSKWRRIKIIQFAHHVLLSLGGLRRFRNGKTWTARLERQIYDFTKSLDGRWINIWAGRAPKENEAVLSVSSCCLFKLCNWTLCTGKTDSLWLLVKTRTDPQEPCEKLSLQPPPPSLRISANVARVDPRLLRDTRWRPGWRGRLTSWWSPCWSNNTDLNTRSHNVQKMYRRILLGTLWSLRSRSTRILNQKEKDRGFLRLPNLGTELAVGGAASTRISSKTRKLPKILIAEIQNEILKLPAACTCELKREAVFLTGVDLDRMAYNFSPSDVLSGLSGGSQNTRSVSVARKTQGSVRMYVENTIFLFIFRVNARTT